MPASDFVDEILELNKKKTKVQEEKELREKILRYFLFNPSKLASLKKKKLNKKKDGSNWGEEAGEAEDRAALEGYLAAEPLVELKQISAALGLSGRVNNNFPIELDGALGFFKPIISFMFMLFSAGNGGLFGMMSRFLHDREVAKNPSIDLNEEEKNSSEHGYLFAEAAKGNKRYNALYREIIKTADNPEQILNGMLRYVNGSLKKREASEEAKTRLSEVEAVLLGGRSFDDAGVNYLCDRVNKNLDASLILATNGVENAEKTQKIQTVKGTFAKLAKQVAERERQLEEDPLTKAKREEFSVFINEHKRKLLHFVVKAQAFAKGETLKPSVGLTGAYVDPKSNAEHASYFDCWLTKVPSADPLVERDSADKMIFKQFRRTPTDTRALGVCDGLVDVDAYKSAQKKAQDDKLKELGEQATNAHLVVKHLNNELVGIKKQAASLNEKIEQLQHKASSGGISDGAKSLMQQQIERLAEQRDSLVIKEVDCDNQAKLLQEAIIRNVIDVAKVGLELSKTRASGGGSADFNWVLPNKTSRSGEDPAESSGRDKIMQALKNSLQIVDLDAEQNQKLKLMVHDSWDKGVSDAIKFQTEFNPQTVNELFKLLQENSDNLLQQSKRVQESVLKQDIPDAHSTDHSASANRAAGSFGSSRQHP